jgi:hypothetical protein
VQVAQHLARDGVEDDAVLGSLQGARPLEAFGIVQEMQAINCQLRICGCADEVVAQAATGWQFAGERRQRKLGRLGDGKRPDILNLNHLGFPPGNRWVGNLENRSPKDV